MSRHEELRAIALAEFAASGFAATSLQRIADLAGNAGSGTSSSGNYVVDTARPTATIVVAVLRFSMFTATR